MTYLDALRKIVRPSDVLDVLKTACPNDTEVDGVVKCTYMKDCLDCWNREMPKEEDHDVS